jgi:hypothetical protein
MTVKHETLLHPISISEEKVSRTATGQNILLTENKMFIIVPEKKMLQKYGYKVYSCLYRKKSHKSSWILSNGKGSSLV